MPRRIFMSAIISLALIASVFLPDTSGQTRQTSSNQGDLSRQQDRFSRVREARSLKEKVLREMFRNAGVPYPSAHLLVRIYKLEREVELWGAGSDTFTLIKTYPICSISGRLGPKRRQGDLQVPEGFYRIIENDFNPASNYYLSMKINYPNRSDRILGHSTRPGGDIFIHGDCVSIGCVSITDDKIKELYIAAVDSISSGAGEVDVQIFPCRFGTDSCQEELKVMSSSDPGLGMFWSNLEEAYILFNRTGSLPEVTVDSKGRYHFR